MAQKTIVVTGCAGYIGSVLTELLLRERYRVIGIDNFFHRAQQIQSVLPFLNHAAYRFVCGDVRDKNDLLRFLIGADAVVPLAALVGAPLCEEHPLTTHEVNFDAIRDMMNLLGSGVRVIYPNTNSGYGKMGERPCLETDEMRPLSLYAQSKCDAEKVVLDHPNAVVFRLATVFGISARMRFDLLVNDLVSQLVLKRKVRLYQPHFRRNYVGIRDVARAILWAIEGEQKGVFNLGHPEVNLTKLELARRICDLLQLNPAKTIELVEGEDHDKRDYFVSNEKILQAGFRFEHTLEQGIIEVAELVRLAPELVRQCRNH